MPLDSDDSTRYLRRNWHQNKSHMPKYSSLPEFQLFANGTSSCRQCGFTGPTCLGCAWAGKEAQLEQHEFASSAPRARRASAPSTVFFKIDFSTFLTVDHANIDSNRPEAPFKQRELKSVIDSLPIVSSQSPYMPVDQSSFDASAVGFNRDYIDTNMANDYALLPVPDNLGDVAKATRTSQTPSLLFAQSTIKPVEYNSEQHNSAMGLKPSRKPLNVSRTDKMPPLYPDDAHEYAKNVSRRYDNELTPTPIKSTHPHSPKDRPLRRKKHLHIMPCAPNPDTSEPIAISLTLHHSSPPTSSPVSRKSSQRLSHSHTRTHSHPQSISSGSGDPVTPVSPTYQRSPPPTSFPPPKTGNSSPIRLGHPARPYYTAIRKNISPPTPSRSRPQSAVTPMTSTTTMTNASRHLSMSAMPPSAYSAFDNDDDGDFEVHSGPSNSARLSLSSNHHRHSYDNRTQTHTRNAQSLSRAAHGMNSNRSNGFGFSMSGETELRMALAASSPSGHSVASTTTTFGRRPTSEDGFRFRETVIPSQNMNNNNNNNKKNIQNPSTNTRTTDHLYTTPHVDSFMGRVKKLRKGLKEMLMN